MNTLDSRCWTPLHTAAAANQRAVFPLLIESGADINAFDINGQSPLILAINNHHLDGVFDLCEAGADVNASDSRHMSPLCMAARRGIEMTNLLLAFRPNPSLKDAGGWTPLYWALYGEDYEDETIDIVRALLEAGADPNIMSQDVLPPIDVAAKQGNASAVKLLIEHGADPNLSASGLDTALYDAIVSGSLETVMAFLEGGAECQIRFKDGWTPMMLVAKQGDREIGRVLKRKGCGLNDQDLMV